MAELYLTHHGVKGMKWGVRRYRNEDGTLTEAGKKRYSSMSDDKLQKTLYKQVKQARTEQSDWSNQWAVTNTIGTHSKAVQDRYLADRKKHQDSAEVKAATKQLRELDRKVDAGKIDMDQYDSEYERIRKSVYRPDLDSSVTYDRGRKYVSEYLNAYGRDLNIGYLKDLGYDDNTAKEFADRVLKANKKMLNGM